MEYVIVWQSKVTGFKGRGTKAVGGHDAAELAAKFLNDEHPQIEHWVEPLIEQLPESNTRNAIGQILGL